MWHIKQSPDYKRLRSREIVSHEQKFYQVPIDLASILSHDDKLTLVFIVLIKKKIKLYYFSTYSGFLFIVRTVVQTNTAFLHPTSYSTASYSTFSGQIFSYSSILLLIYDALKQVFV